MADPKQNTRKTCSEPKKASGEITVLTWPSQESTLETPFQNRQTPNDPG